ncbi:ESAT-6 protein secretion system EspG family protein [Amycolatopsis sulphurea]|uniref:ESAT-6 protein secretion system EspG family protein n=1 Tax=Amycolatopsis sulphurea TaxID=76022 RepID=A0A2A9F9S6_9PSEU|nr:ESX secretion-associated protein EspG [Amycolatopsis sulphurea]PFG47703.1 ESAT-6 protein secretion system EspG family protein [Amycolatopsis sulphurea]
MHIIDKPVRVPRPVFLASWGLAGLAEPPVVVGPDQTYRTDDAVMALRRSTIDALTRLGLAGAGGALSPQYRATLTVLATAQRELYTWSNFRRAGDDGAIQVAASGRDAIRLITDHRMIQLDPILPRDLTVSLVDALPDYAPARISLLRVPTAYLDGTNTDPLSELSGQADEMRHLMRAERAAVHKVYAAVRNNGNRRRSVPLTVYDLTRSGRVLATYGEQDATMGRGGRTELVGALDRILDGIKENSA